MEKTTLDRQWVASPIGPILLTAGDDALTGLYFKGQRFFPNDDALRRMRERETDPIAAAKEWLRAYFDGAIITINCTLRPQGTPFQREVGSILKEIPFGATTTYGEIAQRLARERGITRFAPRAVGAAIARNPISLMIPCHRVVGAKGELTGYAGGLDRKRLLLLFEKERDPRVWRSWTGETGDAVTSSLCGDLPTPASR